MNTSLIQMPIITHNDTDTAFRKAKVMFWKCHHCGHITIQDRPPKVCPSCKTRSPFRNINILD